MKKIFSIFIIIILLANCNNNSTRKNEILNAIESSADFKMEMLSQKDKKIIEDEYPTSKTPNSNEEKASTKTPVNYNRKLIKTGEIKYETDDINKSRAFLETLVKKHHAFIANERSNNFTAELNQNLAIRIPFENFDAFVSDLSTSVSKFDFKNINVQDVTEEYIDIQSRLKAKYKLEESYLALLKKALKIKDIIAIEKELNYVRSDIESMEGRLRYLKDQVSLSTLNITMYKKLEIKYQNKKGFFSKLFYNFQSGFDGLLQLFLGLVSIWPMLLIFSLIIFLIRKWWKKRK